MIRREDDCVGCEHCINCGRKHAIYMYCDKCNGNVDELYIVDDMQVCADCLPELFTHIDDTNVSDYVED